MTKDKDRKNSVMLPMMSNTGPLIENKGKPKQEEMIGGMDNYKKY